MSERESEEPAGQDMDFLHERVYLKHTQALIQRNLRELIAALDGEREKLRQAREELQENQPSFRGDRDKQAETAQYLAGLQTQLAAYKVYTNRLGQLQGMKDRPYFGRVDFAEDGMACDSYYIGRANLRDPLTGQIQVCDWRAPLSGLFYRSALGPASFKAPLGEISGALLLKRQYEICLGELEYYFDTGLHIKDDILKKLLSQQASPRMRSIVESLQESQDILIRDKSRRVLLIQGCAGSGKTSLAMHRAAFLMYQDHQDALKYGEILILSPNRLFSRYINRVLPELGEENITSLTFDDIFTANLPDDTRTVSGERQLDRLLGETEPALFRLRQAIIRFKTSEVFSVLLRRLAVYYERRLKTLPEFYYHGAWIADRQELRRELRQDQGIMPLAKRLERLRRRISLKAHQARRRRLPELQAFVSDYPERQLEIFSFARLLSMKRSAYLNRALEDLTRIDIPGLYRRLFADKTLFYRLSKKLPLPDGIEEIRLACAQGSPNDDSDAAGLLWLRLLLEGTADHPQIRQVIVDEAQDYGPLHYMLLRKWFPKANFTILGDVQQSLVRTDSLPDYLSVGAIMGDPESEPAILRESYRSSWEISGFCRRFLSAPDLMTPFERHSGPVEILGAKESEGAALLLLDAIKRLRQAGAASIAVICKTAGQAEALYGQIKNRAALQLVRDAGQADLGRGMILPLHLVRGLEFDAAILWEVNNINYAWPEHRRLLYLAASRALHFLTLIFSGELSPLIAEAGLEPNSNSQYPAEPPGPDPGNNA
ncbi:MAG: AAA family ATPase [Peptococcaceae bacterium]|jgi:DNA helicase-2/ATP-dependent DNA helicase PcrA|nr:AAA family ATPase [Peptococcaceae bacterium]